LWKRNSLRLDWKKARNWEDLKTPRDPFLVADDALERLKRLYLRRPRKFIPAKWRT
jgi:hypothetical protein